MVRKMSNKRRKLPASRDGSLAWVFEAIRKYRKSCEGPVRRRLMGTGTQVDQGTQAALWVYKRLVSAGLPVVLTGFKALSAEQAVRGDREAYFAYIREVLGDKRADELTPLNIGTPDMAIMPEAHLVSDWIEATSIISLDERKYHALPTPPKDVIQFLPWKERPPWYYEGGYIVYVVWDGQKYTTRTTDSFVHRPFCGKPDLRWVARGPVKKPSLPHEVNYETGEYGIAMRYEIPFRPRSVALFWEDDGQLSRLTRELTK